MTDEQKLISDLSEVCPDLTEWARTQMLAEGKTAAQVLKMLRDAVRLAGLPL